MIMFDRRLVQHFDWPLLIMTCCIAFIGLITLYSAVSSDPSRSHLFARQIFWFGMGTAIMVAVLFFDYRLLERWAMPIYLISVALLVVVLVFGRVISGSQRWLTVGSVSIQPSEFAKIACIIMLARFFSANLTYGGMLLQDLWKPFLWIVVPFMLIALQPDLGSALMVLLIAGSIVLFVKIRKSAFVFLASVGAFVTPMVWFFLKEYQKQRILTFLNPDRDPMGAGYHIIQSKVAIGSGMFFGKGFLKGTQSYLFFLPEQHTDFIFSVLAEEWGFIGAGAVIVCFLILLAVGINVAFRSRENFGTIVAVGIVSMIGWQVFINIGMTMGIMPVVGIPLPMVSYGGTSVLSTLIAIGILLNISMRRFMFQQT
ncbi:MAG: rod shape-determining protein RodA [Pseudomonadota bacterium]